MEAVYQNKGRDIELDVTRFLRTKQQPSQMLTDQARKYLSVSPCKMSLLLDVASVTDSQRCWRDAIMQLPDEEAQASSRAAGILQLLCPTVSQVMSTLVMLERDLVCVVKGYPFFLALQLLWEGRLQQIQPPLGCLFSLC